MEKLIKNILTIIGIVFLFGMSFWISKQNPLSKDSQRKIDSLQTVNMTLSRNCDSLLKANQALDTLNFQYRQDIEKKSQQYEALRRKKDEEISNVISLSLDSAILLLSRELSKEDSF
jgi:glutaredoxin